MEGFIIIIAMVVFWIFIQKVILPRLGIST